MRPYTRTPPREEPCLLRALDRALKPTPEQIARYQAWLRREKTDG